MSARSTSEHRRPMASRRSTPVICSAARLNEVTRHCRSTVKTPSEMLSRMASVGVSTVLASAADLGMLPPGSVARSQGNLFSRAFLQPTIFQ